VVEPAAIVDALRSVLPDDAVVVDPDVVESYRYDRAMTVEPGRPVALVRAGSAEQVAATLQVASTHRIGVVTRGAGTGLSGGSAAVDGCITLSTERMRRIDVDPAAMVAVAQPGALNVEVKQAARAHGLWYPPDPSSFEICSIGGNLATNAGGLCCVKYGVTTDYVLGMQVALADGRLVRLGGRTIKDVAGSTSSGSSSARRARWGSSPRRPCACDPCRSRRRRWWPPSPTWCPPVGRWPP
jgi:glycolate oxidase